MKIIYHQDLTQKKWNRLTIFEQMANIGAEVGRALEWQKKNRHDSRLAFERALELLDLTCADPKNKIRLKELLRLREILGDYFIYDNKYHSTIKFWQDYFYPYNYAARLGK